MQVPGTAGRLGSGQERSAEKETGKAAKIATLIAQHHKDGKFDGVALAMAGGTAVYRGAVGLATRGPKIPHTVDAPLPICSLTKQFTALLVMQQAADGVLSLNAPVAEKLPGLKKSGALSHITARHLLTHTSGLPNLDDVSGFYQDRDPRCADPAHVLRTVAMSAPLSSPPGEKFRYNNLDYIVLAALLGEVSGKPYPVLLRDRILQPLGMKKTGMFLPGKESSLNRSRAIGYDAPGDDPKPSAPIYRLENYGAAGALYATVDDLGRWDRALLTDRLLPRRLRDAMWTGDPTKGYVAMGSWVYSYLSYGKKMPTLVERMGATGAHRAQNLLAPDDGFAVVLLSNLGKADFAGYAGRGLACDILRVLYETAPET